MKPSKKINLIKARTANAGICRTVEQIHNNEAKQEKQLVVLKLILNCQSLFLYLEIQ